MTNQWYMQENQRHLTLMKLLLKTPEIRIRKASDPETAAQALLVNKKIPKGCQQQERHHSLSQPSGRWWHYSSIMPHW